MVSHGPSYVLGQEYLVFSMWIFSTTIGLCRVLWGRFQVISQGGERRTIRIYPTHPLSDALNLNKATVLMELDGF